MEEVDLVAMLCSRLCHDLVGPISAIANGVEVLQDDDAEMRDAAIDLLAHSSELAANRIKFYRLAFGASGGEGVMISLQDARATVVDFLTDSRVEMRWPDDSTDDSIGLSKAGLKLLLNMILIVAESMPRGGDLEVSITPQDDKVRIAVVAVTDRLSFSDVAKAYFSDGEMPEEIPAKASPVLLARDMAQVANTEVRASLSADTLTLLALPARKTS
jgi:histidine phosphotransferase ChpT